MYSRSCCLQLTPSLAVVLHSSPTLSMSLSLSTQFSRRSLILPSLLCSFTFPASTFFAGFSLIFVSYNKFFLSLYFCQWCIPGSCLGDLFSDLPDVAVVTSRLWKSVAQIIWKSDRANRCEHSKITRRTLFFQIAARRAVTTVTATLSATTHVGPSAASASRDSMAAAKSAKVSNASPLADPGRVQLQMHLTGERNHWCSNFSITPPLSGDIRRGVLFTYSRQFFLLHKIPVIE